MGKLYAAGLCGFAVMLLFFVQAGSAKTQPGTVKVVGQPVWTVAMDWPRVAYASGKDGNSESIHIWNLATGSTSVAGRGKRAFPVHHTAQLAITGRRVYWLRSEQSGNTSLYHWLYTARIGGAARLLRRAFGGDFSYCGLDGPQMGGLAGSGGAVAVSLWNGGSDGSTPSHERLALVTPTRLQPIATGVNAILSESAEGGHIAVLPLPTANVTPDGCGPSTPPTSVFVYSTTGELLTRIALPAPDPSTLGYQVAISGTRLVVLTYGLHQPSGPAWVTLTVYDWTTNTLQHTWPVGIPLYPGEVNFSFYGNLAAVEGPYRLHLVNLDTGKDVKIAHASNTVCPTVFDSHGLVYAVSPHNAGRLVFVPMAKLLELVS